MGWIILIVALVLAYYAAHLLDKEDERKRQYRYRAGGKK